MAVISLLPGCGHHVTSCLMLLPPGLPSQDREQPSVSQNNPVTLEVTFVKDFVTAARKTITTAAQHV